MTVLEQPSPVLQLSHNARMRANFNRIMNLLDGLGVEPFGVDVHLNVQDFVSIRVHLRSPYDVDVVGAALGLDAGQVTNEGGTYQRGCDPYDGGTAVKIDPQTTTAGDDLHVHSGTYGCRAPYSWER